MKPSKDSPTLQKNPNPRPISAGSGRGNQTRESTRIASGSRLGSRFNQNNTRNGSGNRRTVNGGRRI